MNVSKKELQAMLAKAWADGAQTAWDESGEGWNSEGPSGVVPLWIDNNPYATEE